MAFIVRKLVVNVTLNPFAPGIESLPHSLAGTVVGKAVLGGQAGLESGLRHILA